MAHPRTTKYDVSEVGMEFEPFLERSDIQISRVLTTPKGDNLRAIVTTGGSIVLTAVGRESSDTVILTGDVFEPGASGTAIAKGFWDAAGDIIGGLVDKVVKELLGGDKGGGSKCRSETTLESDAKTGKTTVKIIMVCGPA